MPNALSPEQQAVLDVIDAEQQKFWSKDWEGFARCYLHSPATQRWGATPGGGIYRRQGWEDLGARAKKLMAVAPEATRAFAGNKATNLDIRVVGDMALATYERHYDPVPGLPPGWPAGPQHGLRVLERHNGEWRILLAGNLDPEIGGGAVVRVAPDGKILWSTRETAKRLDDGDDFSVRSGKLHLRDRRSDARLREAIRWAAGVDWNMVGMRGARPVVLDRAVGPNRVIWVAADAGMILVILEDSRPPLERLSYAADVFRLSPAQVRLAAAIIEDRSLGDFATAQGISVNTARTHMRRLFEKVGVHTQPALVRVLLSLSAPR